MIHLQITPDHRLDNSNVEHLAQSFCTYYSMIDRWNRLDRKLERQPVISFETVVKEGTANYYFSVLDNMEPLAIKTLNNVWQGSSIEKVSDPLQNINPSLTLSLEYKFHYCFAFKVDRRSHSWIASLLEISKMLLGKDQMVVQVLCEPAPSDWFQGAVEAYQLFKSGAMPQRIKLNKEGITRTGLRVATSTVMGAISVVTELLTGEEPEKVDLDAGERALILKDGHLRRETILKSRGDAYDVTIRIAIQSTSVKQAIVISRMAAMAFRELDGDNQLVPRDINTKKSWPLMLARKKGLKLQSDYMSIEETSRLLLMPTGSLQEKYNIENIKSLETTVPDYLFDEGLLLGEHTFKGETKDIYFPLQDEDETCLPTVVIGGMGQGKTKGFGANRLVEAVRNGYGALFIDPAKHEVSNEIKKILRPEEYEVINISKLKPSFDWIETKYSDYGKGLLADAILCYFEDDMESAPQAERYLRAFVMAMRTAKLNEIFTLMEDKEYLQSSIKLMKDGIHKQTLIQYKEESEAMRLRIIKPIYNRFDLIMGDPFLMDCFESETSIDFVEILSQKKVFIIDVAKKDGLTAKQINIIGNLLMTKINLAMQFRKEENQFPFFVIADEPHQFTKSSRLWESMAVESRKWRVGLVWLFHYWEQLPNKLQKAIRNALPHYHIYPTSKQTFFDLKEEIYPFEITDCLNLKRFHAINVLRTNGGYTKPFIAKMTRPPSER